MKKQVRVLMAKPGLDGHERGARALALGLRDEGMEIIYTGIRQTPEAIVDAAIQEDVDVVGLSCLSGAHNVLFGRVADLLKERQREDVLLIGGGIIPERDIPHLREKGFKAIFGPGSTVKEISNFIKGNVSGLD